MLVGAVSLRRKPLAPAQGGEHVVVEMERGQHDDVGRSGQLVEVSGGGDPVHVGHPDVHQHDVGLQRGGCGEGVSSVGGFADDVDGGVGAQDHPQSGAHEGVVVDEERTGRHRLVVHRDHVRSAETRKWPSAVGPCCSVPPEGGPFGEPDEPAPSRAPEVRWLG